MYYMHLKTLLKQASAADRRHGKRWYHEARQWCENTGSQTGTPTRVVAGMVAALSPRNKWKRNLQDTRALLHWLQHGGERPMFATYNTMIQKAIDIYNSDHTGREIRRILNGPKITAFLITYTTQLARA